MQQTEIAQLIQTLSTGIYGIGVHHDGEQRIFTASWVMPVSFDPVLIALSINPQHRSYPILKQEGFFSINVIGLDQAELAEKLATPAIDFRDFNGLWDPPAVPSWRVHSLILNAA